MSWQRLCPTAARSRSASAHPRRKRRRRRTTSTPGRLRARERTYTQLWRTQYSEAYAIGWKQAGDTGFHDHDGSVGAVYVVRGTVAEEHIVLRPGGDWLARVEFAAGETFRFDGAHIHRMRHAAGETALTVHVYSPPLGRAGAYELADDGTLRRHSMDAAEELRASDTFQEHRSIEDPPEPAAV